MPHKASGKYAYGFCERTGFRYPLSDLVEEEETGYMVGYDIADPRHPQDYPEDYLPHYPDPQALHKPRPDRSLAESQKLFSWNPIGVGNVGLTARCGRTDHRDGRVTVS